MVDATTWDMRLDLQSVNATLSAICMVAGSPLLVDAELLGAGHYSA